MKRIFKNWKTSLSGLGSVVSGLVMITKGNAPEGFAAILTGIGLIFSKDADVTGL